MFFRTGYQFGVPGCTYPPKKYPSALPPGAGTYLRWRFMTSVKRKGESQQCSSVTLAPFGVCEACNKEKDITLTLLSVCKTKRRIPAAALLSGMFLVNYVGAFWRPWNVQWRDRHYVDASWRLWNVKEDLTNAVRWHVFNFVGAL